MGYGESEKLFVCLYTMRLQVENLKGRGWMRQGQQEVSCKENYRGKGKTKEENLEWASV